eukprot:1031302-Pleurochrysis_carterae.AAC.1
MPSCRPLAEVTALSTSHSRLTLYPLTRPLFRACAFFPTPFPEPLTIHFRHPSLTQTMSPRFSNPPVSFQSPPLPRADFALNVS